MSGKSKRQVRRWSRTQQINEDLLVFLWSWVSTCHPDLNEILRVKAAMTNITESLRAGTVTLDMINKQLIEECNLMTDWARRDRG